MSERINVVIVSGICSQNKRNFGIRFEEERRHVWIADWAFQIKAEVAKREGYDRSEIKGAFQFSPEFPGCPHCERGSFVKCSCGVLSCSNPSTSKFTCPGCGTSGDVDGAAESLTAGRDG